MVDLAPHNLDGSRFVSGDEPIQTYAETEPQIHARHSSNRYEPLKAELVVFANLVLGGATCPGSFRG